MTALVSIDCATGFLARHTATYRGKRPTHVAMIPRKPRDVAWVVCNFLVNPEKRHDYRRRLPLIVAV